MTSNNVARCMEVQASCTHARVQYKNVNGSMRLVLGGDKECDHVRPASNLNKSSPPAAQLSGGWHRASCTS